MGPSAAESLARLVKEEHAFALCAATTTPVHGFGVVTRCGATLCLTSGSLAHDDSDLGMQPPDCPMPYVTWGP
jgi:hypothetical protein